MCICWKSCLTEITKRLLFTFKRGSLLGSFRRGLSSVEDPVSRFTDGVVRREQLGLFWASLFVYGLVSQHAFEWLETEHDAAMLASCLLDHMSAWVIEPEQHQSPPGSPGLITARRLSSKAWFIYHHHPEVMQPRNFFFFFFTDSKKGDKSCVNKLYCHTDLKNLIL